MMPFMDPPPVARHSSAIWVAAAVMGSEGYAPVGPVRLRLLKPRALPALLTVVVTVGLRWQGCRRMPLTTDADSVREGTGHFIYQRVS